MNVMFEVYLAPGALGESLITQQTLDDTQAQVMTLEQAKAAGFSGFPDDPQGRKRMIVLVPKRDERRIQNQLDAHPEVGGYMPHDVDM